MATQVKICQELGLKPLNLKTPSIQVGDPKNYGNYGIFLIMGNAGFISSTVVWGLGIGADGLKFQAFLGHDRSCVFSGLGLNVEGLGSKSLGFRV